MCFRKKHTKLLSENFTDIFYLMIHGHNFLITVYAEGHAHPHFLEFKNCPIFCAFPRKIQEKLPNFCAFSLIFREYAHNPQFKVDEIS